MVWNSLNYLFSFFCLTWLVSLFLIYIYRSNYNLKLSLLSAFIGNLSLLFFTILLWIEIERPPLKTLAETRLIYALIVSWIILLLFYKTKNKILFILGFLMSISFLIVDILHPEYQTKNLMPALQSIWFVPHVLVYMLSYAILGAASLNLIVAMFSTKLNKSSILFKQTMNLIIIGFAFLSIGLILGAIWAKIAWGDYWTWDPKENFALLTWLFYLLAIHLFIFYPHKQRLINTILIISFFVLIITWFGIKYFPSGVGSVHIY